jgi:hypothetical protein
VPGEPGERRSARAGEPGETDRPVLGETRQPGAPDLGDLVVVLLASALAGLSDRLAVDGFTSAADLLADLVEAADDYLFGLDPRRPPLDGEHPACG